jgi:hypothetical protein
MGKLLIIFISITLLLSQELPALQFGLLVSKCNQFNRKEKAPKLIVINNDDSDKANEIAKMLNITVSSTESVEATESYASIIFIDVKNEDIFKVKKKIPNSITYTDSKDNISVCSIHLGLKEDKKPLILVNMAVAKAEADLSSTFLKIAQLYQ